MADEWFGIKKKDSLSIKEVVMQHIKGISDLSRQEFTPSYWQKKPLKVGDGIVMSETYHEDKRLAYCNAIDFLHDLMMPYADEEFKKTLELLDESENKRFEEHKEKKQTEDEWIWVKLSLRRTLFGKIIMMIHRIKFFEFIPFVDYGSDSDDDEEKDDGEESYP